MKKKLLIITLILTVCVALVAAAGCTKKNERTSDSYVRLDINPAVELIVDADDKVVSVYGANSDGTVLLYGEAEGFVGKDVESVVNSITESAVKLGYLDENNKVVQYTVSSPDGEKVEKDLTNKITAKITASAASCGITVTTDGSGAYSLLRKFNAFKEEHPDNAAIQNMSVSQFRLALSASESGEITLEAAVTMNDKDLVETLKKAADKAVDYATAEYKALKAAADAAYESATAAALDGIYAAYYSSPKVMNNHPNTWYYGSVYQMYATAYHGLDAINYVLAAKQQISSIALSEDAIKAVAKALGLNESDVDLLKDADGNITLDSIYAYADKTFKNSDMHADIEATKKALDDALSAAEKDFTDTKNAIMEKYGPQINAIYVSAKAYADAMKTSIEAFGAFVPQSVKDLMTEMQSAATELKNTLTKKDLSAEDIAALSAKFKTKANDTLERIKADLTAEELAEVEALRAKAEATLTKAKAEYDAACAKAEEAARKAIEKIRNDRVQPIDKAKSAG